LASDVATIDGVAVPLSVTDEHTATFVTPAHTDGAAVISLAALNGRSSSLDPGFIYGSASVHQVRTIQPIPHLLRTPHSIKGYEMPRSAAPPARTAWKLPILSRGSRHLAF
jgi:hypothetical protein